MTHVLEYIAKATLQALHFCPCTHVHYYKDSVFLIRLGVF